MNDDLTTRARELAAVTATTELWCHSAQTMLYDLIEQYQAALRVAEAAKTYRDVRGDYSWVQMIQALDAWEHPNPAREPEA